MPFESDLHLIGRLAPPGRYIAEIQVDVDRVQALQAPRPPPLEEPVEAQERRAFEPRWENCLQGFRGHATVDNPA